jgi:hypothetical protein
VLGWFRGCWLVREVLGWFAVILMLAVVRKRL